MTSSNSGFIEHSAFKKVFLGSGYTILGIYIILKVDVFKNPLFDLIPFHKRINPFHACLECWQGHVDHLGPGVLRMANS